MLFSSIALFASALTCSYLDCSRAIPRFVQNVDFDDAFLLDTEDENITYYLSNFVDFKLLQNVTSNDVTLLSLNVTQRNNDNTSKTFYDFVTLKYRYYAPDSQGNAYFGLSLTSPYGKYVAPSLFFNLSFYYEGDTFLSKQTTRVVSSVDNYVWNYVLNVDDTLASYTCHIEACLIPTIAIDPEGSNDYQQGYQNGYDTGSSIGYTDGYNEGKTDGENIGYNTGYNTGKTDGYNQGYEDALSTHDFTFTNLFASLSDTPVLIIRRLFGFELFGVSLISVFMSLLTALIIIHLIKKVF